MKRILSRRPSPAVVISTLALFVSLSGVSYGVATGFIDSREIKNNEIRSRDIRNNEVRGIDIRNSTVQGSDLAPDTLTGEDINETTLGKVPTAASADSSTNAKTASELSSLKLVPMTTVVAGNVETLLHHGPLTVTVACVPNGADLDAELRVETSEANSAASGDLADYPTLDPADGAKAVGLVKDTPGGERSTGHSAIVAQSAFGASVSGLVGLVADLDYPPGPACRIHAHLFSAQWVPVGG
jgi:hypothetical protein